MSDFDYNCLVTEDENNSDDAVVTINDYYNNSDICEVCAPTGGAPTPHYIMVRDTKEDIDGIFYNVAYTL